MCRAVQLIHSKTKNGQGRCETQAEVSAHSDHADAAAAAAGAIQEHDICGFASMPGRVDKGVSC